MMNPSAELADLLGSPGWLTDSATSTYATDWLGRVGQPLLGVARPASTDEVSRVLVIAQAHAVAVIPQGGNTSLCGGTVSDVPGALVVSLERMNRIVDIDEIGMIATVDAGVVLGALHDRLDTTTMRFPLHLGAEGSACIGGLIATNAGGSHAARHGMMMDRVLGLEVVLAGGRVWNGLRGTLKDNAGYALRRLFCGSEGTLGIITRAVLRLAPAARYRSTALLAVSTLDDAVQVGRVLRESCGDLIDALEFFTETGLAMALAHVDQLVWPLDARGGAYILVELASTADEVPLDAILEKCLGDVFEASLVSDGAVAANEQQRAALWSLREALPEGQRREGVQLKHDIAVPVGAIAQLVRDASAALDLLCPGGRVNAFGHLADGNIHLNLSPPLGDADFGGTCEALSACVYRLAHAAGGSIAAEHGLGRTKVEIADTLRDPVERELMVRIKAAMDPAGGLNPGAVVGAAPNRRD